MEETYYNRYLISLRTGNLWDFYYTAKIKLAYALGINVVKWIKELVKITFQ